MILQPIYCPYCNGTNLVKNGKTSQGKQRFICRESRCERGTFIFDYSYPASNRKVKQQIGDMALNRSGVRDPDLVLHVSPSTVIRELKQKNLIQHLNLAVLRQLNPEQASVEICLAVPTEAVD